MLSQADNALITNTDRGTPMGELFRRFWLPVALSAELPGPDSTPLRVRVMGEDLIAFRDSDGRVGLVDAYCPHRGAPMFFGRNEENGLRCVYHGWKFDVDGFCTDLPNAPEGETFKSKIHITSYPCEDRGGLIWAYMGPAEKRPPFPDFEWTKLPESHRYISKFRLECNYLQAMEGDYDPSHAGFLHSKLEDMQIVNPLNQDALTLFRGEGEQAERFPWAVGTRRVGAEFGRRIGGTVEDNDSGIFIVMASEAADGKKSAFVMPWMMPIFCTAGIQGPNSYSSNMRIPIDNRSLMFYRLRWSYSPLEEKELNEYKHGEYYYPALIPGSWKTRENVSNDYGVDRVAQKYFTYTGIKTFPLQDIAMMENQWGPLADRTREHLTSMDHQIIYVRRRLLRTAKALAEGIEPSEPFHPEAYAYHTASVTLESGTLDEALSAARAESMRMHLAPARVAPAITT